MHPITHSFPTLPSSWRQSHMPRLHLYPTRQHYKPRPPRCSGGSLRLDLRQSYSLARSCKLHDMQSLFKGNIYSLLRPAKGNKTVPTMKINASPVFYWQNLDWKIGERFGRKSNDFRAPVLEPPNTFGSDYSSSFRNSIGTDQMQVRSKGTTFGCRGLFRKNKTWMYLSTLPIYSILPHHRNWYSKGNSWASFTVTEKLPDTQSTCILECMYMKYWCSRWWQFTTISNISSRSTDTQNFTLQQKIQFIFQQWKHPTLSAPISK